MQKKQMQEKKQEGHYGPESLTRDDLVTINYCAQ